MHQSHAPAERPPRARTFARYLCSGSPFCSVALYSDAAKTAADDFAVAVAVSAHERAHSRWSPECLFVLLFDVVWTILLLDDGAWERAKELGERAGIARAILDQALDLLRSAAAAGVAQDVVPVLARRLAGAIEKA